MQSRTCHKCGIQITTYLKPSRVAMGRGKYCRQCAYTSKKKLPPSVRFAKKVNKSGIDGCWLWTGSLVNHGYGVIYDGIKMCGAHVFAWVSSHGRDVPEGMQVCHTCDNRACVNPDHLFLGTMQDNMNDKVSKGRQSMGERHYMSKLTDNTVREIRADRNAGMQLKDIAAKYSISESVVCSVAKRVTWKHVTSP